VSCWSVPLPNALVRLVEPSERLVIVPEPNLCVCPVTVRPSRERSVVIDPEPNGRVSVVVPSDQRVIVPDPNFWVCPVIVRPSRVRSVVIEPDPNGRVWLLVPSDRWVIDPEPNGVVVAVRDGALPARGGVGSVALTEAIPSRQVTSDRIQRRSGM